MGNTQPQQRPQNEEREHLNQNRRIGPPPENNLNQPDSSIMNKLASYFTKEKEEEDEWDKYMDHSRVRTNQVYSNVQRPLTEFNPDSHAKNFKIEKKEYYKNELQFWLNDDSVKLYIRKNLENAKTVIFDIEFELKSKLQKETNFGLASLFIFGDEKINQTNGKFEGIAYSRYFQSLLHINPELNKKLKEQHLERPNIENPEHGKEMHLGPEVQFHPVKAIYFNEKISFNFSFLFPFNTPLKCFQFSNKNVPFLIMLNQPQGNLIYSFGIDFGNTDQAQIFNSVSLNASPVPIKLIRKTFVDSTTGTCNNLKSIYGLGDTLKEETDETCLICMTELPNVLINPCEHFCLCIECAKELIKTTSKCPICRTVIDSFSELNVKNV